MAYLQGGPILTRLREVLEDSSGTLRTVPSGRFAGDLPEGLDAAADQVRAASKPRTEATITAQRPSPNTPCVTGNLLIDEIDVEVRVVRLIAPLEQVSDDDRVALQALAANDASIIAQALGYPGNLTTTSAGTATDIISGRLQFISSNAIVVGLVNDGAQSLTTIHTFRGLAISRPAV